MMLREMTILIGSMPEAITKEELARAIVDENILGKPTASSRKESLVRLIQLYGMDPTKVLFRVLWQFGHSDPESLPQLCLVCSFARDPQLRHSFKLIKAMKIGDVLESAAMEAHIERGFPDRFSDGMKASMARNVKATWTFSHHLSGKVRKVRSNPELRPLSATYAMFVGYLSGLRGESLLESDYGRLVAANRSELLAALSLASARGLLSLKQAGGVVEFDFSNLLTTNEEELISEPH